jgi:hypothetical protein
MKLVNRIKIDRRVTTSGPPRQGAPVIPVRMTMERGRERLVL